MITDRRSIVGMAKIHEDEMMRKGQNWSAITFAPDIHGSG